MKLSVRNLVIASAMMAAVAVTTTSAMAATTVKVPFNFTVEGKICPAGTYTVDKDVNARIVTLQGKQAPQSFKWVLTPADSSASDSKVKMSFEEVGNAHSLKSIQYGSMVTPKIKSKAHEVSTHSDQGQ